MNTETRRRAAFSEYGEAFRDPYVLDFLGLDGAFSERELEAAVVSHIERFLLELGHGFCFVGRQRRPPSRLPRERRYSR